MQCEYLGTLPDKGASFIQANNLKKCLIGRVVFQVLRKYLQACI